MRNTLILFVFILATLTARSQDFDYTLTTDSVAWQELNSQTILNSNNSAWDFSYRIAIGFSFNYLGRNFDSLTIETNGYLVFDRDRNYAFTAFNQFKDRLDESGNHAVIGYELSGTENNHILKIQFSHAGQYLYDERSLSWQVWLFENGNKIELRIGPGNYCHHDVDVIVSDSAETVNELDEVYYTHFIRSYRVMQPDSDQYCRIGLLNQNMDTETSGFFISGSASEPESHPVDHNHPDTGFLNSIPFSGYRYTFTPSSN